MRRSLSVAAVLLLLLSGCALLTREHYVVFFEPHSADLDDSSRQIIASLATKAVQRPGVPVIVNGYAAPDIGVPESLKLSARRARAVADALVADGIPPERIQRHAEGGVNYALDSVESRRVEILLGAP